MDRAALFRRLRGLLSGSGILAEAMLSGSVRSLRRGRGGEFSEAREYSGLDDAASIDWNVSARMGRPFVKVYRDERELPVIILLDNSASMAAFEPARSCRDAGAEAAALIAWAADSNGDRAALRVFDEGPRIDVREGRGRKHVMAIVRALAELPPPGASTGIAGALSAASRSLKRRSLVVLVSDFLSGGWTEAGRAVSFRHELVLARVVHTVMSSGSGRTRLSGFLPAAGSFMTFDPESGARMAADFGSPSFRERYGSWSEGVARDFAADAARAGAKRLEIREEGGTLPALVSFFKRRSRGAA
jgi:uncharacterized protein (DUF58 family)